MSGQVQEEYPLVGSYDNNRSNWFYAGVVVFIGWNILIFALAVAAIAKVNNLDDDSPTTYNMGQTMTLPIVGTVPEFTAVSLLENGTLRVGAGISIYRKEPSSPPFGDGSQNLRMVRFVDDRSTNEVIAVWTNNTGTYAVVATLALDKRAIYAWYQPKRMVFNNFWDLITLPNGHFVVAADTGIYAGTVDTRPGWMNITSMSNRTYPKESWKNIRIVSMGLSYFVLTYDAGLISINSTETTFGAIVGSVIFDMSNKVPNISFVTPDAPVPNSGFPVHDAFALTNSTFAFIYGDDQGELGNPQLACRVGRFTPPDKLTFQSTSIFPGIVPEFYLSAVNVNDENGVVFLVNAANNYDLIAVFIHRNPNEVDGVHFGDVVTIESGVADSFYINSFKNRKVPFIDAARIHSNKLVVAWADFTNNGVLTTALVTIDQALNLHTSPLYVIGNPLPVSDLLNYSVSVASLIGDTEFGAAIIERKQGNCTNLALMEVAPKALGVSNHRAFHGQNLQVTVGGLMDVPPSSQFDLKPGYLYYTKSDGSLVAALLAGTQDRSHSYVTLDDGTIVSMDSVVGIAVGHRQLYVLPSY